VNLALTLAAAGVVLVALSVLGLAMLGNWRTRRERARYLARLARLNRTPEQRAGDGW
jgi:hypothetical protein